MRRFYQISPLTYKISRMKEISKRNVKDILSSKKFAKDFGSQKLPYLIYKHNSLIRRKLNNVDSNLQNNKAVNLSIAAPKVTNILIKPGETFSFWKLVGPVTKKRGYLEGLTVKSGSVDRDIGGGMCQFTNLIHWMVLHSSLDIVEHHHHHGIDMFPDFGRKVPFGTGTSIMYNNLDYQFTNNTKDTTYQLIVYTTDEYLMGELRADKKEKYKYHIKEDFSYFAKDENGVMYRNNQVSKKCIDKVTGNIVYNKVLVKNHAKVLYDYKFIDKDFMKMYKEKNLVKKNFKKI